MKFELIKTVLINLTFNEEEFLLLDRLVTTSSEYGHLAIPGPGAWWNGCKVRGCKEPHQLTFRNIDTLIKILINARVGRHPLINKLMTVVRTAKSYHEDNRTHILGGFCESCNRPIKTETELDESICRTCKAFI